MLRKRSINHAFLAVVIAGTIVSCASQESPAQNMKKHIEYLASDALEGREAGTEAEKKAATYISSHFKTAGLEPRGTNGYYQDFDFLMGKNPGEVHLAIDGNKPELDKDYFVMNFSANGEASGALVNVGFGIEAPDLGYSDFANYSSLNEKIAVFSISSPDGIHPHSKYIAYHSIKDRVKKAEEKGASAVILINEDPTAADPEKNYTDKIARVGIPVIFIKDASLVNEKEYAKLRTELIDDNRKGRNVIGWIDNNASYSVIIGAHYDHLGYGRHGGSLYRGEEDRIHNGADDNASGTAMLIEMAGTIRKSSLKNLNYLFIAFSGEEKGLLGANYFTKNPTIDLENVSYMINMDMVGRLDTADYDIAINGVGTSPVWDSVIREINIPPLNINTTESGVGPSDQTAFYLSDIPVLHFFTGTHENYHKPTDDPEFINYDGMKLVFDYIMEVNNALNKDVKLVFAKTKDDESRKAPRFAVTLGIIPDYMFDGGGLKIDGVSDGKPAATAGLQKGDILIQIGDYSIDDIYAYMEALGRFKKGDKVSVVVMREGQKKNFEVRF